MISAPRDMRRSGFTLVELLVAMAVLVTLAAIALLVVPDAMEQDRTTDGAATVRAQLMMAKARALRDNAPRGVRFLVGLDPNNPAKTQAQWSTELVPIEQPPPVLINPNGSTVPAGVTYTPPPGFFADSYLEFRYTVPKTGMQVGQITDRKAFLVIPDATLAAGVIAQITTDVNIGLSPRLYVAGLGNLYITGIPVNTATSEYQIPVDPALWTEVDAAMGGGETRRFFTFALYLSPRPLLGEPNVLLPTNICVDLPSSEPATTSGYFDILFAPNGQVIHPAGTGQIFLWVRDYTKNGGRNYPLTPAPPYPTADFNQGGEQQIVALKTKSGSLGVFPAMFPATSPPPTYPANQDAFTFARDSR